MQEGLARRPRRAGPSGGARDPAERERATRHRCSLDLAPQGFPRWGAGAGPRPARGRGPRRPLPCAAPVPPPRASRAGAARRAGCAAGQALEK